MQKTFTSIYLNNIHCDCHNPGCPYCDPDGKILESNNALIKKINELYQKQDEINKIQELFNDR